MPRRNKPPEPQSTTEYLSMLEGALRQLAYGQHLFTVFRHFVELSAITLSNVADPINEDVSKVLMCYSLRVSLQPTTPNVIEWHHDSPGLALGIVNLLTLLPEP